MFLYYFGQQIGDNLRANDLLLNILKRGPITYYSVNFDQHKDIYDFYSSDMVDNFLDVVYSAFCSKKKMYKFQSYAEILNQQRGSEVFLQDRRTWLTNVY